MHLIAYTFECDGVIVSVLAQSLILARERIRVILSVIVEQSQKAELLSAIETTIPTPVQARSTDSEVSLDGKARIL